MPVSRPLILAFYICLLLLCLFGPSDSQQTSLRNPVSRYCTLNKERCPITQRPYPNTYSWPDDYVDAIGGDRQKTDQVRFVDSTSI